MEYIDLDVYRQDDLFYCDEYASAVLCEYRPIRYQIREGRLFREQYEIRDAVPVRFIDHVLLVRGDIQEARHGHISLTPRLVYQTDLPASTELEWVATF
jgi:hypothetical protein